MEVHVRRCGLCLPRFAASTSILQPIFEVRITTSQRPHFAQQRQNGLREEARPNRQEAYVDIPFEQFWRSCVGMRTMADLRTFYRHRALQPSPEVHRNI